MDLNSVEEYKERERQFANSLATGITAGLATYFFADGANTNIGFFGVELPSYVAVGAGAVVGDVLGYMFVEPFVKEKIPSIPDTLGGLFPAGMSGVSTAGVLMLSSGLNMSGVLPIAGLTMASSYVGDMALAKVIG